uniref:Subtilase n=1 Tax=Solanum tuberosum TaxID=4113 RepID=M1C8P0_SOLTU
MRKGILVSCSAGNTGPLPGTVNNRDPWLFTVGASTTDRKLRATVRLGDGKEIYGESGFQPKDFSETMLPLIRNVSDAFCSAESLENIDVKGKIVLCVSDGVIAEGGFTAMRKGILVSCSAGNTGPLPGTVNNRDPWLFTVGASTTDRKLRATVRLGDGKEIYGESGFQPKDFSETMLPLIRNVSDAFCSAESLENIDVKGKIVLCVSDGNTSRIGKGHYVKNAGGAGMILVNDELHGFTVSAEPHVVPAAHVSYTDGLKIISYMNSTSNPLATFLFRGTIFEDDFAREVASFSGRGPNRASPGILKPDIVAPGVNILAAWPTKSTFNIASGTSMSCPHVSGIATLVKSTHPDWSPAAIKSAIMTTADLDEKSDLFTTGAGHVNPSRASDPGLIYDIKHEDYVQYLCGLKYPNKAAYMSILRKVNCLSKIAEAELNYPSFSIGLGLEAQTYTRTVTNVGEAVSSYVVEIVPPQGVDVIVDPPLLNFSELNQKKTYQVTFSRESSSSTTKFVQGYLRWTSSKHFVRSPIVVTFK